MMIKIEKLVTKRNTWHNVEVYGTSQEAIAGGYGLMYEDEEGSVYGIRDDEREHCWKAIAFVPYPQYQKKYFI